MRKPVKVATVALANKTARVAWAKPAKVPAMRSIVGKEAEGVMARNEVYAAAAA
jgi:hypothetical protein